MHIFPLSNISFLHQTTTPFRLLNVGGGLSNISFLHQTTTLCRSFLPVLCCQISLFYIKPQPTANNWKGQTVVKYLFSTSNHNIGTFKLNNFLLSNISFLHQTTTGTTGNISIQCCQISLFYIKPQLVVVYKFSATVVKYLFSTSNHN